MTGRLLQVVGAVAILALLGAVAAGFGVLKDRVRIIVASDEADAGPDPTALLRDDVQTLTERLEQLQQAIAANFGQLADGLEGRAQERHGDVVELRREVGRLSGDLATLTKQFAAVGAKVESLQAVAGNNTKAPAAVEPVAVSEQEPETAPEPQPVATEAKPTPTPARPDDREAPSTEKTSSKGAKGSGFLTFTLPETKLAFDRPQTFKLLPKLCRVGFDAKSTLHDFTGVTSAITGSFQVDFNDPAGLCTGEVVVDASTLQTGVEGRDSNMYEHLDTTNHRYIRFVAERFIASPGGVDVARRRAKGEVVGKMTIRGKTRELRMPVQFEVDPQQRLVIKGQTKLKLSDYEVPVPSQLGVINMEDEVVVWIALRARSQGAAK